MTGSMHAAVPMAAGDVFRAEFDRLGPVTVRVAGEPERGAAPPGLRSEERATREGGA
jgi:2-keto-4-pentenoate hydratase